jgi:hypothetical protein
MKDDQPIDSLRLSFHERDNSEPANADELRSALAAAKTGTDPDSAHALMREMLTRIRSGDRSIMPFVENWIIYAFGKVIEDGYSADQAFGLKARKGKYERPDTLERDIKAVAAVILSTRSGDSKQRAIGDAANLLFPYGTGDKAVEKACEKYMDTLNDFPSSLLRSMSP